MAGRIFSNTLAIYSEGKIMDSEKLRRLSEAETYSDAIKMLADYGLGDALLSGKNPDFDGVITAETDKLIRFVEEDGPGESVNNCLLSRFLFNNIKVLYKNKLSPAVLDGALYNIMPQLGAMIDAGDYSDLPEETAELLKTLDSEYNDRAPNPREIDIALTRQMYAYSLAEAKKSRAKTLLLLVKREIDLKNLSSMMRCRTLKYGAEFLESMLIEGGTISFEDILSYLTLDENALKNALLDTPYGEMSAFSEGGEGLEGESDEYLIGFLTPLVDNMSSLTPFLRYFLTQLRSLRDIKTVLVCIKNGVRGEIKTRLKI